MARQQRDIDKERYWAKVIREATRSGTSIREYCAKQKIKESQFYWWQRKLRDQRADRARRRKSGKGGDLLHGKPAFLRHGHFLSSVKRAQPSLSFHGPTRAPTLSILLPCPPPPARCPRGTPSVASSQAQKPRTECHPQGGGHASEASASPLSEWSHPPPSIPSQHPA